MRSGSTDFDVYLAALSREQRLALQRLRRIIRAAAPRAEECLSYSLPGFRLDGKVLCCMGASKGHCAFYPGSGTAVAAHHKELRGYSTSKGAIRFQPDEPLPATLVRRIVRYRIAENAAAKPTTRRAPARGRPAAGGMVTVRNVNHPGRTTRVNGAKYTAMRTALLRALPARPPGLTQAEMFDAVLEHLPASLFPKGATAGWWAKTTQLDLEANGRVRRTMEKGRTHWYRRR